MILYNELPLKLAFNDSITEECNGRYDLTFNLPVTDKAAHRLKRFDYLKAETAKHGYQTFYVVDISRAGGYVKIYAKHVFFLSDKVYVPKVSIHDKNGQDALNLILAAITEPHPFSLHSDILGRHQYNDEHTSLLKVLADGKHSILGQWGGVLVRDNWHIALNDRRGVDTEILVAKRKNIADFENKTAADHVITRLYLKAKLEKPEDADPDAPDEFIETVVESPLINEYPVVMSAPREFENKNIQTIEALIDAGKKIFQKERIDLPKDSFTVKATDEINRAELDIDDTCIIYYQDYGIHDRVSVSAIKYSPMERRYVEITFGDKEPSLSSAMANTAQSAAETVGNALKKETNKRVDRIFTNLKTLVDAKVKTVHDKYTDTYIQGLAKAERDAAMKTAEGRQALITAVTADLSWLRSVVVQADVVEAISANINIAKIKELLATSGYFEEIIQSDKFVQEFNGIRTEINQMLTAAEGRLETNIKSSLWQEIEANAATWHGKDGVNGLYNLIDNGAFLQGKEGWNGPFSLIDDAVKIGLIAHAVPLVKLDKIYSVSCRFKGTGDVTVSLYYKLNGESQTQKQSFTATSEYAWHRTTFTMPEAGILTDVYFRMGGSAYVSDVTLIEGDYVLERWIPSVNDIRGKDAAIISDRPPETTDVLWLDTSVQPPALRNYVGDEWVEVESMMARMNATSIQQIDNKILTMATELVADAKNQLMSEYRTELEQTAKQFNFRFNTAIEEVTVVDGKLDAAIVEREKYIRFVDGRIEIGEVGGPMQVHIMNDRMSFLQDGIEVAYMSNNKLYITNAHITTSLQLGHFSFLPRENGNLRFKKVSD